MKFQVRTILAPANAPITLSELFLSPSIPDPGTRSATPRDAAPTFFSPTTKRKRLKQKLILIWKVCAQELKLKRFNAGRNEII